MTKNNSITILANRFMRRPKGGLQGRHWLTFSCIALGVFALLTVSSVMNGFDHDMRQRIIGTRAEIRLSHPQSAPLDDYQSILSALRKRKDIVSATPVVRNELMLVKGADMAATVNFGIDLASHRQVNPVLRMITPDDYLKSRNQWLQGIVEGDVAPEKFTSDSIVLGVELAENLHAEIGDTLLIVSPVGSYPTPFGMMPKSRSVVIRGLFIAGMPEYDRLYSYVPQETAQFFSGYDDAVDAVEIKAFSQRKIKKTALAITNSFPDYKVEDWSSYDTSLYNAMHFEKYIMLVILSLMFVLASFNMSSNVYKTIVQKQKAIGILKTIGFVDKDLMKLFLRQGLIIGISGILTGVLCSLTVLILQKQFGIVQLPAGNMPNLVLPVDIRWLDFVIIPLISFALSLVSIIIPARRAMQINPITLIRENV